MQIALCHENVLPRRGGAEMYVADLARRLVAAGHDVHLYSARWDATMLPAQLTIHPLDKSRGTRKNRPWQFSATLQAQLRANRPQVSVGFDKVLGTDVYYPLGGLTAACAEHNVLKHAAGWRRWLARRTQRWDPALRSFLRLERRLTEGPNCPVLVANSQFVRGHFQRYYGLNAESIPVLHNSIDPNRFDETDRPALRSAMRMQWKLDSDHAVGAIIAMNYRLKGLESLLQSMTRLPTRSPFRLIVAGSPDNRAWKKLAARFGVADRVRFIGHCDDVRRVLFAADFLVHPTFYDPCSLVVLEAMACGLPVITTRHNGAGELLPAKAGTVIDDPHQIQQLSNAIVHWSDADRRRVGGLAAREAAALWTFDHHVRAFERILVSAANHRLKSAG